MDALVRPTPQKRLLVVSHISPPQPNAGAARLESLVRWLPSWGWEPTVVTSRWAGDGSVGTAQTVRVGEPLFWYRRLRKRAEPVDGVSRDVLSVEAGARGGWANALVQRLGVPDVHNMWVLPAAAAALRIVHAERPNAIMTTSPEESSHLVGMIVSAITGLPWVAEFRDGWRFQPLRGDLADKPVRRAVENRMERLVGRRADALIAVTPPIAEDLRARFGKGVWISNGWDDVSVDPTAEREAAEMLDPSAFNLVYTGTFSASKYSQSPEILAAAMRLVYGHQPSRNIRLTIVGALTPHERDAFAAIPSVRLHPHRPRELVLALQRRADVLVLVTPPGDPSIATGKLWEYVGAARPILALAQDNEAARLVSTLKVGLVAPSGDAATIAGAIAALALQPHKLPGLESPSIRRFHRQALTGELVGVLERITRGR